MKIAVPVKNEQIYQHFGMAAQFKVYTVQNDQIVETEFIQAQGRGHGRHRLLCRSGDEHAHEQRGDG